MKTQRLPGEQLPLMDTTRGSTEPLLPGTEILGKKYVVVRTLGNGGMGFVVAARHKGLGRVDAIKFLLPQLVTNEEILKRFEREAQAVANLTSPHVARVFDSGVTEAGEPYIVMEYLEGHDLKSVLRRGPVPIEDAVDYLLQACDALVEAHDNGIVHRDLKPANLFLTESKNGSKHLKVLDFGIAKRIDAEPVAEITVEDGRGGFLGTIPYMSPEHLKGAKNVDQRTDIWALGVVAYELLTTKKPFNGLSKLDLMSKIIDKDEHPEPPGQYCRGLPSTVEMVINRCLAKNREARYQTVKEFAAALRQAAGIPEPPPTRLKMTSITTESPVELLRSEDGKTQELTQGKTQVGLTVTNPIPSRRPQWVKLGLAGGAALATSATVVGFVMAMWDSRNPPIEGSASPVPETSISASATPLILPVPSASAVAQEEVNDVDGGKCAEDGGTTADSKVPTVVADAGKKPGPKPPGPRPIKVQKPPSAPAASTPKPTEATISDHPF